MTFSSPNVGGHKQPFQKVTFSPSPKGHKELPGDFFFQGQLRRSRVNSEGPGSIQKVQGQLRRSRVNSEGPGSTQKVQGQLRRSRVNSEGPDFHGSHLREARSRRAL